MGGIISYLFGSRNLESSNSNDKNNNDRDDDDNDGHQNDDSLEKGSHSESTINNGKSNKSNSSKHLHEIPQLVKDKDRVGNVYLITYLKQSHSNKSITIDVAGESTDKPRGLEIFINPDNQETTIESRMYDPSNDFDIDWKSIGKIENLYHANNPSGWVQGLNQVVFGDWKKEFETHQHLENETSIAFCKFIVDKLKENNPFPLMWPVDNQ
ncbi:hypothetical protein CYY_007774 [Polysphondylium violaceum]|uniref:Uncharacterized protein n=1 Tax=Polysphondylium violaceum TaxID=133409 RepID=A0A8J4PNV0_9MYCE|nr:hypothetical protein CYY_007774 [Polysphondylium violaceum]